MSISVCLGQVLLLHLWFHHFLRLWETFDSRWQKQGKVYLKTQPEIQKDHSADIPLMRTSTLAILRSKELENVVPV